MLVNFPKSVISAEALKRAAYALMGRVDVTFEDTGADWRCSLVAGELGPSDQDLDRVFRREVLDQDLRIQIEARTEATRSAILGLAFSRTGLQSD